MIMLLVVCFWIIDCIGFIDLVCDLGLDMIGFDIILGDIFFGWRIIEFILLVCIICNLFKN